VIFVPVRPIIVFIGFHFSVSFFSFFIHANVRISFETRNSRGEKMVVMDFDPSELPTRTEILEPYHCFEYESDRCNSKNDSERHR